MEVGGSINIDLDLGILLSVYTLTRYTVWPMQNALSIYEQKWTFLTYLEDLKRFQLFKIKSILDFIDI